MYDNFHVYPSDSLRSLKWYILHLIMINQLTKVEVSQLGTILVVFYTSHRNSYLNKHTFIKIICISDLFDMYCIKFFYVKEISITIKKEQG